MSEIEQSIQLTSGLNMHLQPSEDPVRNGLISDIFVKEDNLDHIMINNDMELKPGKSINCADNILSGVIEETLLSKYFFSDDNVKNMQKMIRFYFFKEKGKVISDQNNLILLTIMRGIYLKYSNSAAKSLEDIAEQIKKLNHMVTEFSLQKIYSNYDMYHKYLNDIERRPDPIDRPSSTNQRNWTYDISERNNMRREGFLYSG